MKHTILVLALFIASQAFSCWDDYDVTETTIKTIPVLGFMEETNGIFNCVLYFRDTGAFKGINKVSISVFDESGNFQSATTIEIEKNFSVAELQSVAFSISTGNIQNSKILINTINDEISDTGGYHRCRCDYNIPINIIRKTFSKNSSGFTSGINELDSSIMKTFLIKQFK